MFGTPTPAFGAAAPAQTPAFGAGAASVAKISLHANFDLACSFQTSTVETRDERERERETSWAGACRERESERASYARLGSALLLSFKKCERFLSFFSKKKR